MTIQTLAATPICSRIRTEEPGSALRTIPGVRTRTDTGTSPLLDRDIVGDRVHIRQRNILGPNDMKAQDALRRAGYLIVCEWDDDPSIFPEIASNRHLTFRACHCVQTSTEPLAELLRSYNPHVRVFRNEVAELPSPRDPSKDLPATILFGALNREEDWREILPGLRRVLVALSDRVRVEVLHDRPFFDALPEVDKTFRPFLPFDEYLAVLGRCDIALLPLAPSRFNRCKSDLKFIECAASGVVCLASPTVYDGPIQHGSTGLIYRSVTEFETLLRLLILDHPLRDRLRQAAYRHVARTRMLGRAFRERYRWYREMCGRLPELDRELLDRVPELR
ncbi:glycosyltransferase family protein [Tautonia plasticadhaerens]|nr:glycosyltransferase [Tautonia plasticadhaerens]